MKFLFTSALLFSSIFCFSQQDEIVFFKVKDDSAIFYLDKVGDITLSTNASFYRKASIDKKNFIYSGKVTDFYLPNGIAYECEYFNYNLKGQVKSYYKNAQLKYKGLFADSQKDSLWTFYYENGQVEKKIQFKNDVPTLSEFYKDNGKPVFINGNGKYSGLIVGEYKQPYEYKISGNIVNGKLDGKWSWSDNSVKGVDIFENGKFIKSSNNLFKDQQLVSLFGFDLHENVDIFKFIAIPQPLKAQNKDVRISNIPVQFNSSDFEATSYFNLNDPNNQPIKFNGSPYLDKTFAQSYTDFIKEFAAKNLIRNFWCFLEFTVNENSKLENIFAYSNNKLISDNLERFISGITGFQAAISDKKAINCSVYICVFCQGGKINVPAYSYNNQSFDIQDLLR